MGVWLRQYPERRHGIRPRTDRPQPAGCVGDIRSAHRHPVAQGKYLEKMSSPSSTLTLVCLSGC